MNNTKKPKDTKRKIRSIIDDLKKWELHFDSSSDYFAARDMDVLSQNMRGHANEIGKAIKSIQYLSR